MADVDKFHKICGEILRLSQTLESDFYILILDYFTPKHLYRDTLMEELFLSNMTFGRLLNLLIKVCEKEDIENEKIQTIKNSTKKIIDIRNKIAHADTYFDSTNKNFVMYSSKNKWMLEEKDKKNINEILVEELKNYIKIVKTELREVSDKIKGREIEEKF